MKGSVLRLFLALGLSVGAAACGHDHSGYNGYGVGQYGQAQYPQYSQYGQYQNYGGQQAWVPYQQPPQNWVPGQPYYQQGSQYTPPYYSYFNQPQNWQYNQGLGWNYQPR